MQLRFLPSQKRKVLSMKNLTVGNQGVDGKEWYLYGSDMEKRGGGIKCDIPVAGMPALQILLMLY